MRGLIRGVLPLVLVAAAGTGAAMAATAATKTHATLQTAKTAKYGAVLADSSGRTLYRYTPDRKGKSVCTGQCLGYWPPALVKSTAKMTTAGGVKRSLLSTIKAAHGMRQLTYAGFPLYRYVGDGKAGQVNGQGVDGTWYVVNTAGGLVKKALGSAAAPTTTSDTTTSSGGGSSWG